MIAFTVMNLYVVYPLILGREDVKTVCDLPVAGRPGAGSARTRPRPLSPRKALTDDDHDVDPGQSSALTPRRPRSATVRCALAWALAASCPGCCCCAAPRPRWPCDPGYNRNAFDDEGLYIYMGHRIIDHLLTGDAAARGARLVLLRSAGLYPVLAAMADSVGGLQAARGVSLFFAMVATVGTYGIGARLYGRTAGLLGAAAFVLCGPVIYQSHLAVYDSTMMALVAVAAWLAVRDAQLHRMLWTPAIGALLTLAALVKYAGPGLRTHGGALLRAAVAWPNLRWVAVRRAVVLLSAVRRRSTSSSSSGAATWFPASSTRLSNATSSRPSSAWQLIEQVAAWVGPWLLLAVIGGRCDRAGSGRCPRCCSALPWSRRCNRSGSARQSRCRSTSPSGWCSPHRWSAPLVGAVRRGWRTCPRSRWCSVILAQIGLPDAQRFLTGWVGRPRPASRADEVVASEPGAPILGEQPSPHRYELREVTQPAQWNDTYEFSYGGQSGNRRTHGPSTTATSG